MFDDVNCILFFVAAHEFDQTLPDDNTTKLADSIKQFEQFSNSLFFKSIPIILILDDSDLLSQKIKEKNISNYFSNFEVKSSVSSLPNVIL